ncbi:MAG: sigma-70 family RNA polymerase sigma factor [Acidobacteriota bacterium]|nr:sigma-70 family RNA polymerase sigma factor [Acidobacteriota bacterium]
MEHVPPGEVTVLLQQMRDGRAEAADRLMPMVVHELHRLAQHYLNGERPGHTLQPTALVNEAYLRLVGDQTRDWRDRAHFIGVSASIMRRILIDHARRRQAGKRSLGEPAGEYQEYQNWLSHQQAEELLALDVALDRLEKMNARQRQVVELRYFGGLTLEETAQAMNISPITVKRDWAAARAWLRGQVRPETLDGIAGNRHGAGRVG